MTKHEFIEESRFAKVVATKDGPALLIYGQVINISSANPDHALWLASALRSGKESISLTGGFVGTASEMSGGSPARCSASEAAIRS